MLGWAGAVGCERFPALDKLMATDEALEGYVPFPPEFAERYRRLGYWEPKTFGERLDDWAARFGERTAIVAGEDRVSYHELSRRADRRAGGRAAPRGRRGGGGGGRRRPRGRPPPTSRCSCSRAGPPACRSWCRTRTRTTPAS